jgi:hypothetical protein
MYPATVTAASVPPGKLPTFLTPLMHASYNGRDRVVRLLLERRAQPNIGYDSQTHTALDFAEMQGHSDCIKLLEPYRLPSLERLVSSLECGNLALLRRWAARGGNPDYRFTAQMPHGRAQVASGPSPTLVFHEMIGPLLLSPCIQVPLLAYAAMKGQGSVVEWLLNQRADPNCVIISGQTSPDTDGHTPLMQACLFGHATVVRRLLKAGARLAQRSSRGYTALQLAEQNRHLDCAREFKEHLLTVAEQSRADKQARNRERADAALSSVVVHLSNMEADGLRSP